jgi:transketolase
MLLYSVLHLSGYPLTIDDIKSFRQLGAHTAGHPERDLHLGIETTTGPLGQGIANAVGMALAEKLLAAQFNRPGFDVVDHRTWVFLGDGCMMEGVSHEACSLAGTLKLGKLVAFFDDNGITIDGDVKGWCGDDTPKRFEAYGWNVIRDVDGHDADAIAAAVAKATAQSERPTLICCKTVIGKGSPNKAGSAKTHGEPLGTAEIEATRQHIGWLHPAFEIPADIRSAWDRREAGAAAQSAWDALFAGYSAAHPELATEFTRRMSGELPASWAQVREAALNEGAAVQGGQATRQSSQVALNAIGPSLGELVGGSADLSGSNNTFRKDSRAVTPSDASGNYVNYGVREFGMTAIMNGMTLHGGFRPYAGTFLVFSDYARNAVRLAALMKQGIGLVYTHDSIASLRLMPNVDVWRPCDAAETAAAWVATVERADGPTALVLTRQALPQQPRSADQQAAMLRGGYTLLDTTGTPEAILIATGSEIALAVDVAKALHAEGRRVRVVSMPCVEAFDRQTAAYREAVLPAAVTRRVAIEAGSTGLWWRHVGTQGRVLGIDQFGASGKAADLFRHFGLTTENLQRTVVELLNS